MSKKSAVILASLISFFLGMVVQNLYSVSKDSWESLESVKDASLAQVSKTEHPNNIVIEKKPFFPKSEKIKLIAATEETEAASSTSPPNGSSENVDYLSLDSQLAGFKQTVIEEVGKKFTGVMLRDKPRGDRSAFMSDKLEGMFLRNQLWYETTVEINELSRLNIYFSYTYCDTEKPPVRFNFKEICFKYWAAGLYDKKWQHYSAAAEVDYVIWKNRLPYISLDLQFLNELSAGTRLVQIVIPFPSSDGELYNLRYEKNKFVWETGPMINWRLSSKKDLDQFLQRVSPKAK